MAEDVSIALGRGTLAHQVRTPTDRDFMEMIRWCKDPDRPGSFAYWGEVATYRFQFSDENLAFEFRMTWG